MGYKNLKFPDNTLFLVTGAAGFIGSNLCEAILNLGYRVRALDDLSTGKGNALRSMRKPSGVGVMSMYPVVVYRAVKRLPLYSSRLKAFISIVSPPLHHNSTLLPTLQEATGRLIASCLCMGNVVI